MDSTVLSCFYLIIFLLLGSFAQEYRSFDGTNNNLNNPLWGSSNSIFLRFNGSNTYSDGVGLPTDGLPSPRLVSNQVFGDSSIQPPSETSLTLFATYWGQFLDHDITLTARQSVEKLVIEIPSCDMYMDPNCAGNKTMTISRSNYTVVNGVREQINMITSYIDGSQIYGASEDRAKALRTFQKGMLKTSVFEANTSYGLLNEVFPPKNEFGFAMDNDAHTLNDSELYFVGDVRGNENPGLLSLQVLFLREHNRLANQLSQAHPDWDDEKLYQETRKRVIAYIQHITFREYAPVILGTSLGSYQGYNSSINAGIITEFSTGAFRYGHSEVAADFLRLTPDYKQVSSGSVRLKSTYFNPPVAFNEGLDAFIRGLASNIMRAVDVHFIDDLRNYLFAPNGPGLDLVAINIMRQRDHGIPLYNDIRRMFGLTPVTKFSDITNNTNVAISLNITYNGDIEKCELYVCGLAETPVHGGAVGETFRAVISLQYNNIRHGDRFWYENPGQFTDEEMADIQNTTLALIILRNTNISFIQCNVMAQAGTCQVGSTTGTLPTTGTTTSTTDGQDADFVVNVALKTQDHPYYLQGDPYGFVVNGVQGPALTLIRGKTYKFKVLADCTHSLYISTSPVGHGTATVSQGVSGSSACSGSILTFYVDPEYNYGTIYYQCDYHDKMGWKIIIKSEDQLTTGGTTGSTGSATTGDITTSGTTSPRETTSDGTSTTGVALGGCITSPCKGNVCNSPGVCNTTTGICGPQIPLADGTSCKVQDFDMDICYEGVCSEGVCKPPQKVQSCSSQTSSAEGVRFWVASILYAIVVMLI